MTFDLERARVEVDTASARRFSESREQARIFCAEEILPDALDEIERLRAENEEALESLTAAYLLGRHEKAQEVAARPKEGKIDSSEHVTEPTKMIGFDLEKARAVDIDLLATTDWGELRARYRAALAEIERLRASLTDLHAEYINTLEKNPGCSAWDLDEQSIEDQRRLRKNAAHAISIVEPPIYLQAEQLAARIKELEDAHKRSGKKYAKIINELRSSVYANIPGLDVGKIGPDASESHLRPYEVVAADLAGRLAEDRRKSWQITEERIGLLEYCLETLLDAPDIEEIPGPGHSIEMLRAMLREAEQ